MVITNYWGIFFTFILPFALLGMAAVIEKMDEREGRKEDGKRT